MRSFARARPVLAFLVVGYGLGVVIFALPLLSELGLGLIPVDLPGLAPFIILAGLGLIAAAFLVSGLDDGRPGVTDLRRRVFHLRVNPLWYLVALTLLPVAALLTAVVATGSGPIRELMAQPDLLGVVLMEAVVAFLLVNWWEEAAWTGFVVHRLQRRIGPIWASVVSTWMQAIIHLPLVFVADGVTEGRVAADEIPFYLVALFVLPIPVRIMITWLYNASGRSVPIVGLFHAGLGVATGTAFVPELAPTFNEVWTYAGFAAVAIVILAATRGRLGYHADEEMMGADSVS